ncbi:DNA translocase FtsK [Glaciecola sp. KUL10]|uniref:DNA translocase FtsK n=1 Tax=Glaciecola sp. (strain KUL10) TaxID=2161813 RepID=UPI000D784960|nr:DNA translocase FtsK [Glaciecola sp. KUL10]GBL02977.1 cell division protein FtsK [Glaciecola sp. KUL10]
MARLSGTQRIMEVGIMLSCTCAFFLLIALATFHPSDPGWSQAGLNNEVSNLMGPIGAWVADIFLFTFGITAYTVPFVLAFCGWYIFLHIRNPKQLDFLTISLRIIGALLLVFGFTGLASMNFDDFYSVSAGGAMGDIIGAALVPHFSFVGTVLLLLCFFCTGFTLSTGISWISIIDNLGAFTITQAKAVAKLPIKVQQLSLPDFSSNKLEDQSNTETEQASKQKVNITSLRAEPPKSTSSSSLKETQAFTIPDTVFEVDESLNASPVEKPTIEVNQQRANTESSKASKVPDKIHDLKDVEQAVRATQVDKPEVIGEMPSFDLLQRADKVKNPISPDELEQVSRLLEEKLRDFNVEAQVTDVLPGPVITRFELELAPGVKVSKITSLSVDLARAMLATRVRVVEVIPGKSVIGLELPNKHREMVRLSEVISTNEFQDSKSPLTMVLGADISGNPVVVDLGKMPHLLVAGTTGSGKSVGVNVMILSLLYKSTPEDVRLIMIDPKMLELSVYEGIPHLLAEVVTDMKEASNALRWCVGEMERRYRLMSALGVRNLAGYNKKIAEAKASGEPILDPLWKSEESMEDSAPELDKLPSIVVVVDEFADMMMIVGKKVEELIARIAQKARAAGIHLILATQRPSVDVITGLIKANIPTRIAFQVSSKIDSRTILDQQGAESLLGMGDMLYNPPGTSITTRVHGAFVDDHEVHAVVADWKARGEPQYIDEILNGESTGEILLPGEQAENEDQEFDAFYDEAVAFVTQTRKASVSSVQRKFRIGYNRAARLVEQMEQSGVVSSPGHNGNREVLAQAPPKD